MASCSQKCKVWGKPSQGENFLFSSIVLVYKTGKTRKIDLKLCHVHRNKSLTKSRYGDDISNTKKGKCEITRKKNRK